MSLSDDEKNNLGEQTKKTMLREYEKRVGVTSNQFTMSKIKKWTQDGDKGTGRRPLTDVGVQPSYARSVSHITNDGHCIVKDGFSPVEKHSTPKSSHLASAISIIAYVKIACTSDDVTYVTRKHLIRAFKVACKGADCFNCYLYFSKSACKTIAKKEWEEVDPDDVSPDDFSIQ